MFKALKDYWNKPAELKPFATSTYFTLEDCEELWAIHEMPTSPSDKDFWVGGWDGSIADGRGGRYVLKESQAARYLAWEERHTARVQNTERLATSFVVVLQAQDAMEKAIGEMKQ